MATGYPQMTANTRNRAMVTAAHPGPCTLLWAAATATSNPVSNAAWTAQSMRRARNREPMLAVSSSSGTASGLTTRAVMSVR